MGRPSAAPRPSAAEPRSRAISPTPLSPLPQSFYGRATVDVARDLLGKLLVRTGTVDRVARIVEVEAYLGERDAASHARRGPTPRAAIMFGPAGVLYVYLVYGMHNCMNVVTEAEGVAGAVLIRAAEPVVGWGDRGGERLLAGPGKVCAALGITRAQNGISLVDGGEVFLVDDGGPAPAIKASARIGVDYAGSWARRRLRFFIAGNRHVSASPRA
jgi:DNA-3-methyladenine glycosylase